MEGRERGRRREGHWDKWQYQNENKHEVEKQANKQGNVDRGRREGVGEKTLGGKGRRARVKPSYKEDVHT